MSMQQSKLAVLYVSSKKPKRTSGNARNLLNYKINIIDISSVKVGAQGTECAHVCYVCVTYTTVLYMDVFIICYV